jgi:hypothetical protein
VRRGERILLAPPDEVASALPESLLDATEPIGASKLDLVLRSTEHGEFLKRAQSSVSLVGADGAADSQGDVVPTLEAHVVFDPRKVAAGRALDAGEWQVLARVTVAGFQAEAPVRHRVTRTPLTMRVDPDGRVRLTGAPVAALKRRVTRSITRIRRRLRRSGLRRPR